MKNTLLTILVILTGLTAFSQKGIVMESLEFASQKLDYPVKYSVYLPADYETSLRSYPVIYLLHGFSDDETGWIQFGEANATADRGVANGDFPPAIIIMPNGKVSWYCDAFNNKDAWQDMFINELIPYVEKVYRIRNKKDYRAIAGLSMGGYGALQIAMKNPELFSTCIAMSAGVFTDQEIIDMPNERYNMFFGAIFGDNLKGINRINDNWKANSPLHLIQSVSREKLKSIRYYIDCGDDDFLYKGNSTLHIEMRNLDIPHEYRVRQGTHSWEYWRTSLFDGLKYAAEKFHK